MEDAGRSAKDSVVSEILLDSPREVYLQSTSGVVAAEDTTDFLATEVLARLDGVGAAFSLWRVVSTTNPAGERERFPVPCEPLRTRYPLSGAMADEQQYQDEDRSAAKTLWLGDVQVGLARTFLFSRIPRPHFGES